jgi:hypothetical protein
MNLSVSPQMRIVALAGGCVVLLLGLVVFMMGHKHASSTSAPVVPAVSPPAATVKPHHVTPHVKPHTRARVTPAQTRTAPSKSHPVTKPVAKAKPVVKTPAVVKAALAQGWPSPIAKAFAGSKVVVAVVYSSDAALDRDALAEATAGAAQAGVPVVPLDVSADADAATRRVLEKLGMVDSPATLVLQRPGTLFVELDGYSDQESVGQAVANALLPA